MSGVPVTQLGRKLRMLVTHGFAADMTDLAGKIGGRSPETLRWWQSEGGGRAANTVPDRAFADLLKVFGDALPSQTPDQLRRLVLGPADDLEHLLAPQTALSFRALIEREADRQSGTLYREDGLGLIKTHGGPTSPPQARVRRGEPFRIEFATRLRGGFIAAFQAAPGGWGSVPSVLVRGKGVIHLPDTLLDGSPGFMSEDNEIGRHLFIAAQAARPFPPELEAAARDGLPLDRMLLAHIVRAFEAQDRYTRRLFALDIDVVKETSGGTAQ